MQLLALIIFVLTAVFITAQASLVAEEAEMNAERLNNPDVHEGSLLLDGARAAPASSVTRVQSNQIYSLPKWKRAQSSGNEVNLRDTHIGRCKLTFAEIQTTQCI